MEKRSRRSGRKRKRWQTTAAMILVALFFLMALFAGYYYWQIKKTAEQTFQDINRDAVPANETESMKSPFTVLALGIEDYMDGVARTDVILFNVINPKSKEVAMLTIPRDSYVYIESKGYEDKINHAYVFGGLDGTMKAVYRLLDIPIDYYISTNFNGFTDMVDAVGGVDVKVPFTFDAKMVDPSEWKTYTEGPAHLNGREALAYVRMRKDDPEGDFGRSKRQKEVIKAIVKEAVSLGGLTRIDSMLQAVGNNVQMNIPHNKFLGFLSVGKNLIHTKIDSIQLQGEGNYIGQTWYYMLDENNVEQVKAHLKELMSHTSPSQAITFEERLEKEKAEQNEGTHEAENQS